jgi:homoaconitase/3-isopropylmalate dehydratase large subunit
MAGKDAFSEKRFFYGKIYVRSVRMRQNIVEKILTSHLKEGELVKGSEIGIRIDQTLTQDATGTMAYLQFEAMGLRELKTDLSVSYVDHNTVQIGFENADDHKYLQTKCTLSGSVNPAPPCSAPTATRPPAAA